VGYRNKMGIFGNLSTTAIITEYWLDFGSPSIKSIDMDDHGLVGIGKGCKSPDGFLFSPFAL
jgi:hypothetical protein